MSALWIKNTESQKAGTIALILFCFMTSSAGHHPLCARELFSRSVTWCYSNVRCYW